MSIQVPAALLLEQALWPLLRLAQLVSGVEWTFVASIAREQRAFRARHATARDLLGAHDYPFVAGGTRIGAMRRATAGELVLGAAQRESMGLIADAMQHLLVFERERARAVACAESAGLLAAEANGTARREVLYSQQMNRLAHTDALTGLPNRRAFMRHWDDAAARSKRRGHAIGLMLIDADRFKAVNDRMGHAMGDIVLRAIGATLMSLTQPPDFAARIGGDEFALCIVHSNEAQMRRLGEQIRLQFAIVAAELGVSATLSIGMVSSEGCAPEDMLGFADLALYRSKQAGGDATRLYAREGFGTDAANAGG